MLPLPPPSARTHLQPEVQVNPANWDVGALQQPEGEEEHAEEDDEVWKQFQTMDEQKRKHVSARAGRRGRVQGGCRMG